MLTLLLTCTFAQSTPAPVVDEEVAVVPAPDTGEIEFDSRLPAEIAIDGQTVAQLYQASVFRMRTEVGPHKIVVLTNGRARQLTADVSRSATAVVLVGRNGLTASTRLEPLPEEDGFSPVELRSVGSEEIIVEIGKKRYRLQPGARQTLSIPIGRHKMFVRSASGTVLWAKGQLVLTSSGPVIVQLTEGRMPEISGRGSSFVAGS